MIRFDFRPGFGFSKGQPMISIVKANDHAETTATYVSDSELIVPIDANEHKIVEFHLPFTCDASSGIGLKVTGPASPVFELVDWIAVGGATATAGNGAYLGTGLGFGPGTTGVIILTLTIKNGVNAGNIGLQVAQSTHANSNPATILAGSRVSVWGFA